MTDPVAPAVDLEELRRLAEAAAESEHWFEPRYLRAFIDEDDDEVFTEADAAFIAAANPATILSLLDQLAALQADREATRG